MSDLETVVDDIGRRFLGCAGIHGVYTRGRTIVVYAENKHSSVFQKVLPRLKQAAGDYELETVEVDESQYLAFH